MRLTAALAIRYPIIMAPMFLVSNEKMVKAAMDNGIAGTFPSLNFRKEGELKTVLGNLNEHMASLPSGQWVGFLNDQIDAIGPLSGR